MKINILDISALALKNIALILFLYLIMLGLLAINPYNSTKVIDRITNKQKASTPKPTKVEDKSADATSSKRAIWNNTIKPSLIKAKKSTISFLLKN